MRSVYRIAVGAAVGLACGAVFGINYAVAGTGMGIAGGTAAYLTMK